MAGVTAWHKSHLSSHHQLAEGRLDTDKEFVPVAHGRGMAHTESHLHAHPMHGHIWGCHLTFLQARPELLLP